MSQTKRTRRVTPASSETLLTILETLPGALFVVDDAATIVYVNASALAMTGATREEVVGKAFTDLPAWSHDPAVQQQLRAAIARASRGETVRFEARIHPRTEMYLDILMTITSHRDASQQVKYLICAALDITEHKHTEGELRVLLDAIPQLVWTWRPDGFVDYTNQRWLDYTGMTTQQVQGDGWLQSIHPDDRSCTRARWQSAFQTGRPYEGEQRVRNGTTGTYRWFLVKAAPLKDARGQIVKWFGTCTDIDEQKRIEEALRQSQQRVRALIDSNLIGITSSEWEGEVMVEANEAFLQMSGYTQEDIGQRTLTRARITPPEDAPLFERALQELAAHGQHTPFESELVCKDGSRLPILAGGVLFPEHPRQIVGFALDNSARKELERRKDAFISMASHELRNPLAALKLQTTLLHRQLAKQGILAPALSSMETQITTITRLVEELLDVSKIQVGKLEYRQERVDLDALLWELAETMQHSHPSHRILVHGAVQTSLLADRDRLGQVFTNLLENAIKYSPDAGAVELDLSSSPETVTIRVRDHGPGIPQEQRDKIFERFYRAAGPKQREIGGLGMGLYIVSEIIKHLGGTITVESAVGKGSTFTVTLPRKRDG